MRRVVAIALLASRSRVAGGRPQVQVVTQTAILAARGVYAWFYSCCGTSGQGSHTEGRWILTSKRTT